MERHPAAEMNVYEAILARRSVRRFTTQAVNRAVVRLLLEAAVRAPSSFHDEPRVFAVIDNASDLDNLSQHAAPLFIEALRHSGHPRPSAILQGHIDPASNIFHNAGTLIVICADSAGPFATADCWLAAENLMLAACAMGLGSCVVGSALPALSLPEIKTVLGIPEKLSAVAPIVVGYPAEETPPAPRREPRILPRTPSAFTRH
jgi:nitroreductase